MSAPCFGCGGVTHCSCSSVVGTALVAVRARDAEIERLRARVAELEKVLLGATKGLVAAISLLRRGGKAPSAKMFRMMLNDYERAAQAAREKLLEAQP
jgi:uncharacterized protein with PIN domain